MDLRMTAKRLVLFASLMLVVVVLLQQCWQRFSPAEKWLYFFEDPARHYAGQVLGPGRGSAVAIPESLAQTDISVHDDHVLFSPRNDPALRLVFAPAGPPPAPAGSTWVAVRDGWYTLGPPSRP